MVMFLSSNPDSGVAKVEFSPSAQGNAAYIHLATGADEVAVKQLLSSKGIGQTVVTQTMLDGHAVLVTRGPLSQDGLLNMLGGHFAPPAPEPQGFEPWKWRGKLSIVGQSLQLASAKFSAKGIDAPTAIFAVSNLMANGTNIVFGAEKAQDVHQLRFLKEHFNAQMQAYLPQGESLPSPDDSRAALRHANDPRKGLVEQGQDFIRRNSVRIGEIGLRYFGAFALAFPVKNWRESADKLAHGNLLGAYQAGKNKDALSHQAGMAYLVGKSIALTSKIPDPYDPTPHTLLDTIREKVVFRLSSVIEGFAAFSIALNGFTRRKIKFSKDGKEYPDVLGGVGGMLFTLAQGIRYFAPFGTKVVDMEELNAHMTDGLARMPRDRLPQLVADAAASIVEHFKEKHLEFGTVYSQLADGLQQYHGIDLSGAQLVAANDAARFVAQPLVLDNPAQLAADAGRSVTAAQADLIAPNTHLETERTGAHSMAV
ncbi:hypothetical protein GC177_09740 [bacterium]|nr:hypothetical protein [bacterium]